MAREGVKMGVPQSNSTGETADGAPELADLDAIRGQQIKSAKATARHEYLHSCAFVQGQPW